MPELTPRIGIKKPLGNEIVSRETFNENWDIIDAAVVTHEEIGDTVERVSDHEMRIQTIEGDLIEGTPIPTTMKRGMQVLNAPKDTPFNVLDIRGRTLINLLGRDGNCEDTSKWLSPAPMSISLDNRYVIGSKGMLVTHPTQGQNAFFHKPIKLDTAKYYYMGGYALSLLDTAITVGTLAGTGNGGGMVVIQPNSDTKFKYGGFKFKPTASDLYITAFVYGKAGVTTAGVFDALSLYEISKSEYDAIDSMTPEQLAAKYPYVDDVKPIRNPYVIRYGQNLLPPFTEWGSTVDGQIKDISSYSFTCNKTNTNGYSWKEYKIPVVSGQKYSFQWDVSISGYSSIANGVYGAYSELYFVDSTGNAIGAPYGSVQATTSQTVRRENIPVPQGATFALFRLIVHETATGTFTFTNPILNIGTQALPFEPRNDDYTFLQTSLHSNVDGTVCDRVFMRDGKPYKLKWFEEVVLDGSLPASLASDSVGFKGILLTLSTAINKPAGNTNDLYNAVKYDGKILKSSPIGDTADQACLYDVGHMHNGKIFISIPDTDSGWGENYTPTQAEIQAYFMGWKMRDSVTNAPYTGGTKAWGTLASNGQSQYTQVLPTATASDYTTPYKLLHQRATPIEEAIQVEGDISLKAGANMLEVGEGVIIREVTVPIGNYINAINTSPPNRLQQRPGKFLEVQKNGKKDTTWNLNLPNTYNGEFYYYASNANPDTSAAYSVTYTVLDRHTFTVPLDTLTGEYRTNIGGVVSEVVQDVADLAARVSVTENSMLTRGMFGKPYGVPKLDINGMLTYLGSSDNRSVVLKPRDYPTRGEYNEFKIASIIGLSGMYAHIKTISPWNVDDSGGPVHQLAFADSGKMYQRIGYRLGNAGNGNGEWGNWREIAISGVTSMPAVKSIQKGISQLGPAGTSVTFMGSGVMYYGDIVVAAVNTDRCVVTTRPGQVVHTMYEWRSSTVLRVYAYNQPSGYVQWEVIEYV